MRAERDELLVQLIEIADEVPLDLEGRGLIEMLRGRGMADGAQCQRDRGAEHDGPALRGKTRNEGHGATGKIVSNACDRVISPIRYGLRQELDISVRYEFC